MIKYYITVLRSLSGKGKKAITQQQYEARLQRAQAVEPLVEDEERGIIREGAITRTLRRRQVEEYDEETAPKQARLRDVSDFHLYRKRTIAPSIDDSSNQMALVHNAAVVSTHKHVVEILKLQNFTGAYFNSLNKAEKENLRTQIESTEIQGKISFNIMLKISNFNLRHRKIGCRGQENPRICWQR